MKPKQEESEICLDNLIKHGIITKEEAEEFNKTWEDIQSISKD